MTVTSSDVSVIVVGGGPVGLAAALSISRMGIDTVLATAPHRPAGLDRDRRTAALFSGSVQLLKNIGAWAGCEGSAEPLKAIRILDDTGALFKAPEVTFTASEIGLEAFGFNVPNAALVQSLQHRADAADTLRVIPTAAVTSIKIESGGARVTLEDGQELTTRLVVAADGRNSVGRTAAGITTRAWTYPQTALVTWFAHQRDHSGISTEFHRRSGPFTTVPMPDRASSLVWVEQPDEAKRLAALDDDGFRRAIEERLAGLLGSVLDIGPRALFPLTGLTPERFGQNRVALVGEAAHVMPPIGAQGLNLGLRDAACLGDCLAAALIAGRDIGGPETLQAYSDTRAPDITSRTWAVDVLNRSLLSHLLPVHLARGFGLFALGAVAPLRQYIIREGLQPTNALPALMQPGGLDQWVSRLSAASYPNPVLSPA